MNLLKCQRKNVWNRALIIADNENLTFRGNSIPTKAMEAYMKLVGEKVCSKFSLKN